MGSGTYLRNKKRNRSKKLALFLWGILVKSLLEQLPRLWRQSGREQEVPAAAAAPRVAKELLHGAENGHVGEKATRKILVD